MLRYYFDITQLNQPNLFAGLQIAGAENNILEMRAKYPVIYLSFKDAKANSWDECLKLIQAEISDVFSDFNFLAHSEALSEIDKNELTQVLRGTADSVSFQMSLKRLTKYLYNHYKQKVIILIDEYDTPIHASYKEFYDQAIPFMRNLLSGAFKDNSYLYKGVITGILRVSKESIFTGMNNVRVYSILENQFSDKFGFTPYDVKQITANFGVSEKFEQIKAWYNGYKFGETVSVYNPWSVVNYITDNSGVFRAFWANTASDDLIKAQLQNRGDDRIREQFLKLFNDEPIEKPIDDNFVFADLGLDKELLWTLLLFSGYLTVENRVDWDTYALRIPNYEIKKVLKTIMIRWLSVDVKLQRNLLTETANHLVNNRLKEFEIGFRKIIGDTFSYFDTQGEPENVYQAYVLGLLAILGDDYLIRSNRESGAGRYDILMLPHNKTRNGVVIEIKQLSRKGSESDADLHRRINQKIKEAALQIERNRYYMELVEHGVELIIKLPIVFVGKEPYIFPIIVD
jgi:hypothetical protein